MSLPCAQKYRSTLAHSDGKRASRSSLATRAQKRPLPADLCGLVSPQAAWSLCVTQGMHARSWRLLDCAWKAAAGGTSVRYHAKSCDSDHDCSPEWPPRAAVWHETRTRAAGMHAEYVWPSYAAQLRRCPRVSACVPDWVCLQASCSADSQKISLLGSSVGSFGARAVLLIIARRSCLLYTSPSPRD